MHGSQAHTINATLQLVEVHKKPVTLHPWESLEYLNQFQCIPHNSFTTYNSFDVVLEEYLAFHRNPWQCDLPPQSQKRKSMGTKGELTRLSDVILQD